MNFSQQPATNGVARLCAEARECAARNDYGQALQLLQRARGLDPQNDKVLLELGRVSAMSYDFASAERYFADAVRASGGRTEVLLTAGHHWMDVRNFESATKYFEQTLQTKPVPVVTFLRLAEMYGRLRRDEDVAIITERALREYPEHEGALLSQGKWLRQARKFQEAENVLRRIVSNTKFPAEARAAAGYELGAVLDAQEHYDDAMQAFVDAKTLLRPSAALSLKVLLLKQARMAELAKTVDAKVIERWRDTGRKELQPARNLAVLCGHPRSGTTLLEYVLDSHPQVLSADEIAVFQSKVYFALSPHLSSKTPYVAALDALTPRTLRQVRVDYYRGIESFLGQAVGDRLLIDKNPAMTFDIAALNRVFPESKFLVALRDPRDVCVSCFTQPWPVLPDTIPWLSPEGTVSHYAAMMGLWLGIKPALGGSALEVRYEDLVADVEGNARRTLEFLGLPWDQRVVRFNENAEKKVVRSPTYVEVAKPVYKTAIGRWRNYERYFGPYFEKLTPFLKAFGYTA